MIGLIEKFRGLSRRIWDKLIEWYDGDNMEKEVPLRTKVVRLAINCLDRVKTLIKRNSDVLEKLRREEMYIIWSVITGIPPMVIEMLLMYWIIVGIGIVIAVSLRKEGYDLVLSVERTGWKYVPIIEFRKRSK